METEKREKIENIFLKTLDIPSHSEIVFKTINLLKDEYTSIDEIESLISRDKGFTARFLRIANSPFYGLARRVKTVKDCLVLIGLNTAKSLILATSSIYLYKNFGYFEQKLWEHSLAVGLCSSLLSSYTKSVKPEEALACGILHDIGKVFINNAIPQSYQRIYEKIHETEKSTIQLEEEILGFNHSEVGGFVAEKWNYPQEIKATIQYHHAKDCPTHLKISYINLCNIVKVANQIIWNLGIGFKKPKKMNIALHEIGLDEELLKEIESSFISQYEREKKIIFE